MNEMNDYEKYFDSGRGGLGPEMTVRQSHLARTFRLVYGWMCGGLAISGAIAWYVASSGLWQKVVSGPGITFCIIAQLALVFILSAAINKLAAPAACLMFIAYAALNGLTLSTIFVAYELATIQRVFFITAGMFGGFALYGSFTRSNLSGIGSVCGMALWGLIIAGVVNMFCKSSGLDWAISFAGVVIFSGLTMYDTQKIRQIADAEGSMDSQTVFKLGIIGALSLYLDFINLFLYLLRFFGNRRD